MTKAERTIVTVTIATLLRATAVPVAVAQAVYAPGVNLVP